MPYPIFVASSLALMHKDFDAVSKIDKIYSCLPDGCNPAATTKCIKENFSHETL
jgi:hypothetical protein